MLIHALETEQKQRIRFYVEKYLSLQINIIFIKSHYPTDLGGTI